MTKEGAVLLSDQRTTGVGPPTGRSTAGLVALIAGGLAGLLVLLVAGGLLLGVLPPSGPATVPPVAEAPSDSPSPTPTASVSPSSAPSLSSPPAPEVGTAAALLATLPIKGRAPRTGYDRAEFGPDWADTDRNGCDTRNDVLRRDLTDLVLKDGTDGCVVLAGTLRDPFSGAVLPFARGDTAGGIHIDHVVPLSDAWQKGAQQWGPARRLAFANDPLNLLAVQGALNSAKGGGDAATWLPPDRSGWCGYVARQIAVKAKYGAWVTQAEHDAVVRVLQRCPDEPVPTGGAPVDSDLPLAPPSSMPSSTGSLPLAPPAGSCDPSYPDVCIPPFDDVGDLDCGNVDARRFAVLVPDPHKFDGNGDGTGCES